MHQKWKEIVDFCMQNHQVLEDPRKPTSDKKSH